VRSNQAGTLLIASIWSVSLKLVPDGLQ
jgi:hypothetical protein